MQVDRNKRRLFALSAVSASALVSAPRKWTAPIVNSVILPAHAQTSVFSGLCADGTSTWLMSEYQESGVSFTQGSPQSRVEITISGNQIDLVTDWFVVNSNSNAVSRGRVTDAGTISLSSGSATTSPTGSPTASPTHGGVQNLANNLSQTFTLDCTNSASFVVQGASNLYSFRLTRVG